jgi:hypothetical protein
LESPLGVSGLLITTNPNGWLVDCVTLVAVTLTDTVDHPVMFDIPFFHFSGLVSRSSSAVDSIGAHVWGHTVAGRTNGCPPDKQLNANCGGKLHLFFPFKSGAWRLPVPIQVIMWGRLFNDDNCSNFTYSSLPLMRFFIRSFG